MVMVVLIRTYRMVMVVLTRTYRMVMVILTRIFRMVMAVPTETYRMVMVILTKTYWMVIVAGQDPSMDPHGDMGESEQQKDGAMGGFKQISSIRLDDRMDDG
jgi:hypothetical protein